MVNESVSYAQAITFADGDFTVDNSFVRGLSKLKKEIVSKEFPSRKQSVLDMFVHKHLSIARMINQLSVALKQIISAIV